MDTHGMRRGFCDRSLAQTTARAANSNRALRAQDGGDQVHMLGIALALGPVLVSALRLLL